MNSYILKKDDNLGTKDTITFKNYYMVMIFRKTKGYLFYWFIYRPFLLCRLHIMT